MPHYARRHLMLHAACGRAVAGARQSARLRARTLSRIPLAQKRRTDVAYHHGQQRVGLYVWRTTHLVEFKQQRHHLSHSRGRHYRYSLFEPHSGGRLDARRGRNISDGADKALYSRCAGEIGTFDQHFLRDWRRWARLLQHLQGATDHLSGVSAVWRPKRLGRLRQCENCARNKQRHKNRVVRPALEKPH